MVTHETYRSPTAAGCRPDEVEVGAAASSRLATGRRSRPGASRRCRKSKKNVVDSDRSSSSMGADAARWFLLSDSPPERDLEWSEAASRALALREPAVAHRHCRAVAEGQDRALDRKLHQTIVAVTAISRAWPSTRAIANLYELTSAIEKAAPSAYAERGCRR
jgi:leucyl-tRNA synthetase